MDNSGKGTGLEEGSPLRREQAWRQPSQVAAPAGNAAVSLASLHPYSLGIYLFFFVGRGGGGRWSTAQPLLSKEKRMPLL